MLRPYDLVSRPGSRGAAMLRPYHLMERVSVVYNRSTIGFSTSN